jgi:transcriptional regulator with XRE-family HTH domain
MVGRRLRELRDERRLSAQALADRCAKLGATELKRQVITNLENGRRGFASVDELLALAYALGVTPLRLFLPIGADERLAITSDVIEGPFQAMLWVTGQQKPANVDRQQWKQSNSPLAVYQRIFDEYEEAAGLEARGGSDDPELLIQLKNLSKVVRLALDSGLEVPELPENWISHMRQQGWLKPADQVPVSTDDGVYGPLGGEKVDDDGR